MNSCSCGKLTDPSWRYCPLCGNSLHKPNRDLIRSVRLIVLLTLVIGFGLTFAFRERILGTPKTTVSQSINQTNEERLFQIFLATGNTSVLFEIVDSLIKKKPSELNHREKLLLVDSLTALSKAYPENLDIKFNLGLTSFLFGAYSKAEEIFRSLSSQMPERKDITAFIIASLIGSGEYEQALEELDKSNLDDAQRSFLMNLALSKKNRTSPPEPKDGKEAAILEGFNTAGITVNPATPVIKWFYNHPIVGEKILSHSIKNGVLKIEVSDFPVDKMPDRVREQFVKKIRDFMEGSNLVEVQIFENNVELLKVRR